MGWLIKVRELLEMIRFSHTIFALPFALLAAVMTWTVVSSGGVVAEFNGLHLLGIVICMVGARSAAMAFNRLIDRDFDARNPRTSNRAIPSGKLGVTSVVIFMVVSIGVFIGGTLIFLPNWLPVALAAPVMVVILGYSYSKRFTSLAHFWLGCSLMLAPIATWIALRGEVVLLTPLDLLPAVLLGSAVMMWVAGFDIIYACQDIDFDRSAGLKSLPTRFGVRGALRIAALCHLSMVLLLASLPIFVRWAGLEIGLGWLYWLAVGLVALLLLYEHLLVRPDDLTRVNVAFFNVNAIVSFGLFLLGSIDLLWL